MEFEEYLNIVSIELEKAYELEINSEQNIEYYREVFGIESKEVKDNEINLELANARIKAFKDIILLPIFYMVQNMTLEEIEECKNYLKKNIRDEILKLQKEKDVINENITLELKDIDKLLEQYKDTETYSSEQSKIIEEGKKIKSKINQSKEKIDEIKQKISDLEKDMLNIDNKSDEEIKNILLSKLNIDNLFKLDLYKTTELDKIAYHLYEDSEIAADIINKIFEYHEKSNQKITSTIEISDILNDYKYDKFAVDPTSWIVGMSSCQVCDYIFYDKTIKVLDENAFNILLLNIEEPLVKITKLRKDLIELEATINKFCRITNKVGIMKINQLIVLNSIIKNTKAGELIQELKVLNKKSEKIEDKKIKFKKDIENNEMLQALMIKKANEVLNILWDDICYKISENIINIKHNAKITCGVYHIDIEKDINKFKNKVIIDCKNYDSTGLIAMKLLIKDILDKYNEIISELKNLKEKYVLEKEQMIENKKEKQEKLKELEKDINVLIGQVVPNFNGMNPEKYDELFNILTSNEVINSKVKVEIEELIELLKKEYLNQVIYNLEDLYEYKEKIVSTNHEIHKKLTKNNNQ